MFIYIIYIGIGCKCVFFFWFIVYFGVCVFGEGGRFVGVVGIIDCCF